MKWTRHKQEPPSEPADVAGAQRSLEETHDRWAMVRAAAAALRHERELNHFAENVQRTMRRPTP